MNRTNLDSLRRGRFPVISGLRQVRHCGFETASYAEYLIDIPGWGSWPAAKPLRFKIGEVSMEAGPISPALALLCEATYRSPNYFQTEFSDSYASLRIEGSPTPQADAQLALFYLNADYLRAVKAAAGIHHLVDPKEPNLQLEDGDPAKLVRRRVRSRERIATAEPVALFNQAAMEWGDSRFLGFYRVLEFYFYRGALSEFGRLRRDSSTSDAALLESSRLEKELPQLKALGRAALTRAEARKLIEYASHHGLADAKTLDDLLSALYVFRNKLVHAKESEIRKARIPNPFRLDEARGSWAWIAESLAVRAVRRLSSPSGA